MHPCRYVFLECGGETYFHLRFLRGYETFSIFFVRVVAKNMLNSWLMGFGLFDFWDCLKE